jgi:hypothetical protein
MDGAPEAALYKLSCPPELPSILSMNSASAPVGSVVGNSGNPEEELSKKKENASGNAPTSGVLAVELNRNDNVVPNVISVRYSLKKLPSDSVTVPGSVPLTLPSVVAAPKTPLVEKPESVTALDGVPPSRKSKASWPVIPAMEVVSIAN